ncbi:ABC transporter ATP-binding protein [Leadbettera azotonutricia]|uniref:Putative ABC transporter, ATP-binding protein n=1 Tax=Leadbettera azotonutricia (strain ATCC BAA-888 / DSM 13862 / ZAS-9) TaxID=545695 RepID=F5YA98_LEAAZ|nr:ABC transporter ATP-binding protein [Leadbettera azotonutricia]AEF81516.1 putative ABC transporter, ATP-binding protein [Leadbettera azotonutricia ZAS-9]
MPRPKPKQAASRRSDLTPALCFKNFSFQYKAQSEPTLHSIDLAIERGEKILVLGPSGSGKSTLTYCINGLIPHAFPGRAEGSIFLMGEDISSLSIFDISKKVGTVLQDTDGQFVGLSAAEDIAFAAENDCVGQAEMRRRVLGAARLVNMEGQLSKSPQDLSGGQKQRISIAGVLIDDVDILLFDEPLANLDPASGKDAMETIDRLHKETGKTVIIVEHRLEDVLHRPVDRIIVMDEGRIIADLPPGALLASSILRNAGIREPLYLTALRYAGVSITAETHGDDINRIAFDKAKLQAWNSGLGEKPPPPDARPLLEIKDLSFSYPGDNGSIWALEHIDFAIPQRASVSLVGKNGAGKSTLAKLICGFEKPASGSIYFEGRDISDLSIKERAERIGYVMQNPNQMFSFPLIFDEAALALRNRGAGEAEVKDRVYNAFRICGLYPFRNWPVSALSYGQKKRLSIASILVMDVKLLILDEPTAGQDFRHYTDIMEFLRRLNLERGLAILMITHDMHLMLEYSDKAVVIADGKLAVRGDAAGLSDPRDILTDDGVIEKANLKRTSLYDLALRAGIEDPRSFVKRFIDYDRQGREAGGGQ